MRLLLIGEIHNPDISPFLSSSQQSYYQYDCLAEQHVPGKYGTKHTNNTSDTQTNGTQNIHKYSSNTQYTK